ncbi:MAG TPA: hypothetical protein VGJ87_06545 [Roseiflexaceae bacterium]|jgi:hypothetical protein
MAAVAQPMQTAPHSVPAGRERQALSSWRMTALAYLLLLVLGYLLLTSVVTWGQRRLDDLRYSFPRTTQLDGFVGHGEEGGEPTHLLALNLRGQVSILEFPGGDPAQTRAFAGPYVVGADGPYVVPSLALQDVNGDTQADLLLQVRDEVVVYINENGAFRLITPVERARLAPPGAQGR